MLEIRLAAVIALVAACDRQQGEAPAKEHLRLEGDLAAFRLAAQTLDRRLGQPRRRHRLQTKLRLAGLDARQVQ